MAEKAAQNANEGVPLAERGALFGAVSGMALLLAPDLELAPKDETETEVDLSIRLLGELAERAQNVGDRLAQLDGSIAAYKGQVTKAENERDEATQRLNAGLVQFGLAIQRQVEAPEFDTIEATLSALGELTAERNALRRSLSAQKGATTRVKNEVEQLEVKARPRRLGPIDDQLSTAELAQLFADTERVEIAFSDGRAELKSVHPVSVPGAAFTFRRGRLSLTVGDLKVRGPADERPPRALNGYALLVEGEQVAWVPRLAGQLTLGGGTTYQLKDDVVLA
jgi:hypothetical protein